MSGGSPQGALLGVLLYLVYVIDIGMDLPHIPPQIPGTVDFHLFHFHRMLLLLTRKQGWNLLMIFLWLSVSGWTLSCNLTVTSQVLGYTMIEMAWHSLQNNQPCRKGWTTSPHLHKSMIWSLILLRPKISPIRKYDFVSTFFLDGASQHIQYCTERKL